MEEKKDESQLSNENKEKKINLDKFSKTKEEEVGIKEFMCPENPGFTCILKHRYSDFIVNEIDVDGNVVWINESKNEVIEIKDGQDAPKEELTEEKAIDIINNNFKEFLNDDEREKFQSLVTNYIFKTNQIDDFIEVKFIEEKEQIPGHLGSHTVDPAYGDRKIHLRKQSRMVRLTLFEGSHELLLEPAWEWLGRQCSGHAPDWSSGKTFTAFSKTET